MADIKSLTKLFQAIAQSDWKEADKFARELAAGEERIGHHSAAQRLRGALADKSSRNYHNPEFTNSIESNGAVSFLTSALTVLQPDHDLSDLQLERKTREQLSELSSEWINRRKLTLKRISRRTKILFHGPPGCGKSVTARALGRELKLPVYVVRFDAVVGAYLGQTALHLRQIFRFAETTPSIILIDEIDALGKRRGNPLDVGELDRVVIALLQELEHSEPSGLLIATSNIARQLDDALWRRFNLVLEFPKPKKSDLRSFWLRIAKQRKVKLTKTLQRLLSQTTSYAEAERIIESEERRIAITSK